LLLYNMIFYCMCHLLYFISLIHIGVLFTFIKLNITLKYNGIRYSSIVLSYRIVFVVVGFAHYFSFLCGVRLRSTYSVPTVSCVSVHYWLFFRFYIAHRIVTNIFSTSSAAQVLPTNIPLFVVTTMSINCSLQVTDQSKINTIQLCFDHELLNCRVISDNTALI
jgi:hypothetical protein